MQRDGTSMRLLHHVRFGPAAQCTASSHHLLRLCTLLLIALRANDVTLLIQFGCALSKCDSCLASERCLIKTKNLQCSRTPSALHNKTGGSACVMCHTRLPSMLLLLNQPYCPLLLLDATEPSSHWLEQQVS